MSDFVQVFEDRLREIETYIDLLDALEKEVQSGVPRMGATGPIITVQQQRILYSSVYLQLYNLVESTVTGCIDGITSAIVDKGAWLPGDLSEKIRREWVRFTARTHKELNYENRLQFALSLCEHMVHARPVADFKVEKGAGGSWDDLSIEDICERIGLSLIISPEVKTNAKRHFRDDQGSLTFIKNLRNSLAHGTLSFAESGDGVTVSDLRDLKERTALYLREVAHLFKAFIDTYEFLLPDRRPHDAGKSA